MSDIIPSTKIRKKKTRHTVGRTPYRVGYHRLRCPLGLRSATNVGRMLNRYSAVTGVVARLGELCRVTRRSEYVHLPMVCAHTDLVRIPD
jgi:hypothetical protein